MYYESKRDILQNLHIRHQKNHLVEMHLHQAIEIHYGESGLSHFTCGRIEYDIAPGEIAFIPSCIPHARTPLSDGICLTCIIPYTFFKVFEDKGISFTQGKLTDRKVNQEIRDTILKAEEALEGVHSPSSLLLQGYTAVILGLIAEYYPAGNSNTNFSALMIEIIKYIWNHSKEDLSLNQLAEQFGYSRYYFSNLFHKYFNCNLNSYINQIRVTKVLSETGGNRNMTDVILENGFRSPSVFYQTKRKMGL